MSREQEAQIERLENDLATAKERAERAEGDLTEALALLRSLYLEHRCHGCRTCKRVREFANERQGDQL